jgi:NADPH-dependent 2,4-dienoyl-CoA reductase/sulfur reductase-like enzyme
MADQMQMVAAMGAAEARPGCQPLRVDVWGHIHPPLRWVRHLSAAVPELVGDASMRRSLPAAIAALVMHQIATGQQLANFQIPDLIAGTGITFVPGRAERLDLAIREVVVTGEDRPSRLGYDFLIYAIGSATDTAGVPGVDAHAYTLNSPGTAAQFAHHLDALPPGAPVAVCGNGLTPARAAGPFTL